MQVTKALAKLTIEGLVKTCGGNLQRAPFGSTMACWDRSVQTSPHLLHYLLGTTDQLAFAPTAASAANRGSCASLPAWIESIWLSIILCPYGRAKTTADNLGIHFDIYKYQPDINQLELIEKIKELNFLVDGLMIQLLLPADFDRQEIIRATDPDKDVYSDEMVVVGANFIPNSQF